MFVDSAAIRSLQLDSEVPETLFRWARIWNFSFFRRCWTAKRQITTERITASAIAQSHINHFIILGGTDR
jgi:hypothetical protein